MRTELLASLAVLAGVALAFAVGMIALLYGNADFTHGALYLSLLVAGDAIVVVAYAALLVRRTILRPLDEAVQAVEAIADGDLERRVPAGASREFATLAVSVNRMTDRLLEERAHLLRAEKLASVGRLAAGIAHEIGNPLGAINGYAHLLRRSAASDDARAAVDGLEREAARIDRIVRGLLDYSRAHPRTATRVELNEAVQRTRELLAAQGVLNHVTVDLELTHDDLVVRADAHDLEQVFVNLMLNAVDAMDGAGHILARTTRLGRDELERGLARRATDPAHVERMREPSPRIARWLAATNARAMAKVVIADAGPGVPAELSERIFEPFVTTKDPGRGTGLGLAIVARVVENCAGTVWVDRAREGGAAFHVLLPLEDV